MTEHQVVIAGAGPTGLMLAGELALAGADVAVVECRTNRDLVGSRAGGMTPRTIEVLDQRGIADRFLAEGTMAQNSHYAGLFFDVSDLPTRHNYGLGLVQHRVETILADWIAELGVPVHYGREVTGFAQDDSGVHAVSNGATLRAGAPSARLPGSPSQGGTPRPVVWSPTSTWTATRRGVCTAKAGSTRSSPLTVKTPCG
jgi:2-polyprenyl-6-methoxyphenol hydroxylase-like FAD-dependent oxidoreductase